MAVSAAARCAFLAAKQLRLVYVDLMQKFLKFYFLLLRLDILESFAFVLRNPYDHACQVFRVHSFSAHFFLGVHDIV